MDALLALSVVTFFETFFFQKNIATWQQKIPCNSYKGFLSKKKKKNNKVTRFHGKHF
jgi:hypothetical protein